MRITRAELLEQKRVAGRLPEGYDASRPAHESRTYGRVSAGHKRAPRALEGDSVPHAREVETGHRGGRPDGIAQIQATRMTAELAAGLAKAETLLESLASRLESAEAEARRLQAGLTAVEAALAAASARLASANAQVVEIEAASPLPDPQHVDIFSLAPVAPESTE